jgi:hypothetical protein
VGEKCAILCLFRLCCVGDEVLCNTWFLESAMQTQRTVEIPESVLISAQSLDDLEDWLAAHDPEFLGAVRRIRNDEDLAGQGKDIAEVLKRWPIE